MLLVLTNRADLHADELIRRASSQGVDVFRINTEDLLVEYKFAISLEGRGCWIGKIEDSQGRCLDLSVPHAAWYRKPVTTFRLARISPEFHPLAHAEAKAFLDILYRWPLLHWVNCPLKAQAAKSKLQQLAFAGSRGVCIPSTRITNIPQSFLEFCEAHDWSIVVKAIYTGNVDGMDAGIPTTRVERPTAEQFSGRVALCPTQAQRNIPKSFEVRATVIGRKVFAVSIDSQSHEATRTDWRPFSELCRHDPICLPEDIAAFCVDFLEEFGLSYGAFDFIVSDSGEYTFLECNPFGQYLWTEYETGLEITQAILDHLVGLVGREHPFCETQRL